jgi:DNA-binding MarR family transcriptional regulator
LLRAIAQEDIVYGNLADLVDRTGVSRENVSQRVAILKGWGALDTRMNDRQVLQWIVTPKGRQMLAELIR